jgi:alanyl-tRNA synthetase
MVDGVMPSNEGRGYVLRRIMRRAMRHGFLLGMDKPFIHGLVPTLVQQMGEAYPELGRGAEMAMDVIKMEEERFGRTLKQGMALLDDATKTLKAGDMLEGEVAFKLYDTYGFPLDLTEDALRSRNIHVNVDGFQNAMEEQKQRARAAFKGSGDTKLSEVWYDVQEKAGKTEFLGYSKLSAEAVVSALVRDPGSEPGASARQVEELKAGETGFVVVPQSPFYAESGGQVGDTGHIVGAGLEAAVTDTQKVLDGVWTHAVKVEKGSLKVGQAVELKVDPVRRAAIARNHSGTHLLFAALREVLGSHVVQRGSRQDDKLTRFDISHPKAVTAEELAEVERRVNAWIWANQPVVTRILAKDEAVKSGATAQFGEKYGDEVRVVYMGNPDSNLMITADLCGGTHVSQTGDIGMFRLTSESSVAAGIRRVEGVTHQAAMDSLKAEARLLAETAAALKVKASEVPARVADLIAKGKQAAKAAGPALDIGGLFGKAEEVKGMKLIAADVGEAAPDALREAVEQLKSKLVSGIVILGGVNEGKATLVAGVTKDLMGKHPAGPIVNAAAAVLGGKGGGQPGLAMAGGKPGDMAAALAAGKGAVG